MTMANRVDATGKGVGSVDTVYQHCSEALAANGIAVDNFAILNDCLKLLYSHKDYGMPTRALIASHMNKAFAESGQLYSVRESGMISMQFIASGEERKIISALMSD